MKISGKDDPLYAKIVIAVLGVILVFAVYAHIRLYTLGTGLWYDEAALAGNIIDRSVRNMLTQPLSNLQTAPLLYLICVKALTVLFGAGEGVLRVFSLIAFLITLPVQALVMRRALGVAKPFVWFGICMTATFGLYFRYSHELKPYMSDTLFVLAVLLAYWWFREGRIRSVAFAAICCIVILFSAPAAFFIAGVFITEILLRLRRKNLRALFPLFGAGVLVLAVFVLNYLFWIQGSVSVSDMQDWWRNYHFDFFAHSSDTIRHNAEILFELFASLGGWRIPLLVFACGGFVCSLRKRHAVTAAVGASVLLLLVASHLKMYPVYDRLWLFVYALSFVYAALFLSAIFTGLAGGKEKPGPLRTAGRVAAIAASFALLIGCSQLTGYATAEEEVKYPGDVTKPLIEYVREHIKEGEKFVGLGNAHLVVGYNNGYGSLRIGNVSEDNIVYSEKFVIAHDAVCVEAQKKAYVLMYQYNSQLEDLLSELRKTGDIELVMDVHQTRLYYYCSADSILRQSIREDQ
ncbi:hypothetical protein AGMMS49983_09190 [Clostridia bacterium]|nr:hypothetical protein AGMMS49983_09190 [Clostridia bacterium]